MRLKLSRNFYRDEFACRCGCGFDTVDTRLIEGLERLRGTLGDAPIMINSACRCDSHNRRVGGSYGSQHTLGKAADIVVRGFTPQEVAIQASRLPEFNNGGIGIYATFTHLDVRDGRSRWKG